MTIMKKQQKCFLSAVLVLAMVTTMVWDVSTRTPDLNAAEKGVANPRVEYNERETIEFGHYLQKDTNGDGTVDEKDEKQPITWQILSRNGDDLFLMADKALDCKMYNENKVNVTWESCTLRKWLNSDFLNTAFTETEQKGIITTKVVNADNVENGLNTPGGNDTEDKIYLLSLDEVTNSSYGFRSVGDDQAKICDQARICETTDYAKEKGTYINEENSLRWWLRSPGYDSSYASYVEFTGYGGRYDCCVDFDFLGVRPVLHIKLSSLDNSNYRMTKKVAVSVKHSVYDLIELGNYSGKALWWRVLSRNGEDVFLLADRTVCEKNYNNKFDSVTWETCNLRTWLNDEFYDSAFNASEKVAIQKTRYENKDNPFHESKAGNDTEDKLTILSLDDIVNPTYGFPVKYYCDTETRMATSLDSDGTSNFGVWWLRTPGADDYNAAEVYDEGFSHVDGTIVNDNSYSAHNAIRPALHINLSALSSLKKVGTVSAGEDGIKYYDLEGKQINGTVPTVKPDVTATPKTTVTVEPTKVPDVTSTTVQTKVPTVTRTVEPVSITKPNAVTGFKAKSFKGKLKLSWNEVSGASGYVINYSLKSNFKKAKKVTITKVSTKAKTLKGLKKKKKYFVRIRAYKKSGSKKIYGKWKKISKKTK